MRKHFSGFPRPSSALWHHGDFLTLWAGETISMFGSRITAIALPLAAVTLLHASAGQMGVLRALDSVPSVALGLVAGAWIDRVRRKPLLVGANLGKMSILLVPPIAAAAGFLRIELLYAVMLISGLFGVVLDLAFSSLFPVLVGREHLVEGNGKLETSAAIAFIAGPGLAGLLIQLLSAPGAILADACSFLVAAIAVGRIRAPEPALPMPGERQPLLREIGAGVRAFRDNAFLRAFTFSSATFDVFGNAVFTVYFLYTVQVLHLTPVAIGLIFGIGSIGALLGSLVARWVGTRFGLGRTIIAAQALIGVCGLPIALAVKAPDRAWYLLIAAEFAQSLCNTIYNVNRVSVGQATTPDHLRGRVGAAAHVIAIGAVMAGNLLGGVLGQTIGIERTLIVGTFGGVLPCVWLIFSPVRDLRQMPTRAQAE